MNKIAHPCDVDHVLNICQARCEDLNVQVEWDYTGTHCYTDGHTIMLPMVCQPITVEALDTLYGQVIHETGHHLRPDAFKILKAAKPPAHLCSLFNIVEDDGMERERAYAWRGDRKALSVMNDLMISEITDKWEAHADLDASDPAPLACLALNQLSRLEWDVVSDIAAQRYISKLPDAAKKLLAELEGEGWINKLRATKTPHDTWDLAVDLAKRLYPEEDQDEYEDIRGAGHSMEGTRDDSESSFKDSQAKLSGDNEATTDTNNGKSPLGEGDTEAESSVSEGEGRTVSWQDCVLSEHNEWEKDRQGGELGITWQGRVATSGAALAPTKLVNVVDLSKSKVNPNRNVYSWRTSSPKDYMPNDAHSRAFANKIRRYIQSQARSTVNKDKEFGKIDRSNLYRLGLPPVDGGNWNKKVFYEQKKHTMKDTAIFVLVDWSGSMMGNKMKYAADAAQRLVWCFDRVLNVPVALATFTDRMTFCDVGYVKPYNTRGLPAEEIAERFAKFYWYTSGNNDADAVNWAYHEILKRRESRKILIVMSDGAPSGSWKGHADDCLRLATRTIEADKRVELYGLGICDNTVTRYYTNTQVVYDVHDISPALFKLISEGDKT